MTPSLTETLRARFGFAAFRPGQAEAIAHVLSGQHTLVVMPTGAGKSLVYQLAALHRPPVTLVLSPLIALMKDQVDSLARHHIPATYINSALPADEQSRRLQSMMAGRFQLVYVAPERLRSAPFQDALRRVPVGLLAVDEAHCISQWGHDFRPDYLRIAAARAQMSNPVTVALTATATPQVQDDIVRSLGLPSAQRIVTGFNRPNLTFEVRYTADLPAKLRVLQDLLADALQSRDGDGATIIYVGTRRDAEEVAEFVRDVAKLPAQHYHAGLDAETRTRIQDEFMSGKLPIVVATNAFGMGIDRPDVRLVAHYNLPGTLEAYYQEAGRAGRDGAPARAVLLYTPQDRALQEWFIENDAPAPDEVRTLYDALLAMPTPPPTPPARGGELGHPTPLPLREGLGEGAQVWTTTGDISLLTGLHEVKVRIALAQLESVNVVERLGDEGVRMWLRLGAWDEAAMRTTAADVETRRRHKSAQLLRMVAYAETNACRRRILLNHFGDPSPADAPRCCDNCLAAQAAPAPAEPRDMSSLSPAEKTALIILDAPRKLQWEVGRGKLAQVLKGSKAKDIQQFGYDKHPHYGKLAVFSIQEIEGLIDQLITLGYFKLVGGEYPVLRLTPQAEAALKARAPIPLQLPREVKKAEATAATARVAVVPQPDERTALIILDALRQLKWGVGRDKLADILKGSKAKDIQQWDYDKNPQYGQLGAFTQREIKSMIEQLIEQGYLEVTGGNYPVLQLTEKGKEALAAEASIALQLSKDVKKDEAAQPKAEPEAADTVTVTAQMFDDGLTPAQIAARRGLSESTIYGHLARRIAAGELPLSAVVPDEAASQIRAAVEQVGDVSTLAPIKALLPDTISYGEIRCVVEAWKREKGETAPQPQQSSTERTQRVVQMGEEGSPSGVPELVAALEDPDGNVRRLAASALGKIGDPRAVEPLMALLSRENLPQVRQYAVKALGRIGDRRAQVLLEKIAADANEQDYTQKAAQIALGELARRRSPDRAATPDRRSPGVETFGQQTDQGQETLTHHRQETDAVAAFLSRPHPRPLQGSWHAGWALDFHSRFSGANWSRSGVGELVHRLKYQNDHAALAPLVEHAMALCGEHPELTEVDAVVPVPPSKPRPSDPVRTFAAALSARLGKPVLLSVTKTRHTEPQKDMHTLAQKKTNVSGAFTVQGDLRGKRLLVVDDLFDSGATLEEVTRVLRQAGAARVCVLTLTRTIHADA